MNAKQMNGNKKTFYKVTNEEIYKLLESIHNDLDIMKQQIKVNKWVSSTALSLTLLIVGSLIGKYV